MQKDTLVKSNAANNKLKAKADILITLLPLPI